MKADLDPTTHATASRLAPPLLASELTVAAQTLSKQQACLAQRLAQGEDPQLRRELVRVELALEWCRAGVYGRCCVCGTPLPVSALQSDPADLACERCHALHGDRSRREASMRTLSFTDGPAALHDAFVHARTVARLRDA